MKCDMMATTVLLQVLGIGVVYHPICATGIAIAGGSIPPRTICPGSSDSISGYSSSLLCPEDHPAATETPLAAAAAAAAAETTGTIGEDSMELVGMLESGHHVSISMPKTATEEDVISLLRTTFHEGKTFEPNEAMALASRLMTVKHGYDRTRYWFELGGARAAFDNHLGSFVRLAEDRPLSVLEIGSFEGGSSLWFAEHLLKHPDSRMVCLDSWEGSPEIQDVDMPFVERRFRLNMAKTGKAERIRVVKGDSLLSLASLVAAGWSSSFDVIYVDASHKMADALADCLLSFRLLKVGGTIIVDDETNFQDVAAATAALELALGDGLQILHRKEQVVARKISDRWASSGLTTVGEEGYQSIESLLATAPRW